MAQFQILGSFQLMVWIWYFYSSFQCPLVQFSAEPSIIINTFNALFLLCNEWFNVFNQITWSVFFTFPTSDVLCFDINLSIISADNVSIEIFLPKFLTPASTSYIYYRHLHFNSSNMAMILYIIYIYIYIYTNTHTYTHCWIVDCQAINCQKTFSTPSTIFPKTNEPDMVLVSILCWLCDLQILALWFRTFN